MSQACSLSLLCSCRPGQTEVLRKVMKEEENGGKVLRDPSDPQCVLMYWTNRYGRISYTQSLCCVLIMVLGLMSGQSVLSIAIHTVLFSVVSRGLICVKPTGKGLLHIDECTGCDRQQRKSPYEHIIFKHDMSLTGGSYCTSTTLPLSLLLILHCNFQWNITNPGPNYVILADSFFHFTPCTIEYFYPR